jgi:hypothetical protein
MRELTKEEKATRDRLRERFDRVYEEMMPVLTDFVERLGASDPALVIMHPERYLNLIDDFVKYQVVTPDDRAWIAARLAYYIGELFVQRFGGCWFLNEAPDSRYFLCYVVGTFARLRNHSAMFDPFHAAALFVDEPPGRSLVGLIEEINEELENA